MASDTFDNLLPFEILLLSPCLLPGQTSFKESKASVKVVPEAGETILFFNFECARKSNNDLGNILRGKSPNIGEGKINKRK
jgi:hypothetical protein